MTPRLFADVRAFMRDIDPSAYVARDMIGVLSAVFSDFSKQYEATSFPDFVNCLRALRYDVSPLNYGLRKVKQGR